MEPGTAARALAGFVLVATFTTIAGADFATGWAEYRPNFGSWSRGVSLGSVVNSTGADAGPSISADGQSLYFHAVRPDGFGSLDIWVTHRLAPDLPWEPPVNLGAVLNTVFNEITPHVSADGHYLFFASNRPGGGGRQDIWVSTRPDPTDDMGWTAPVPLTPVNSPALDLAPTYFAMRDGAAQVYFASDRLGSSDLFMSERTRDGIWQAATPVTELNTSGFEQGAALRFDGLEIIFASNRDDASDDDLYVARRDHVGEPWSMPEMLSGGVNTELNQLQPVLSADGRTLYYAVFTAAHFDLFASTRSLLPPGRSH